MHLTATTALPAVSAIIISIYCEDTAVYLCATAGLDTKRVASMPIEGKQSNNRVLFDWFHALRLVMIRLPMIWKPDVLLEDRGSVRSDTIWLIYQRGLTLCIQSVCCLGLHCPKTTCRCHIATMMLWSTFHYSRSPCIWITLFTKCTQRYQINK